MKTRSEVVTPLRLNLQAEAWLISLTETLRQELPRPRYFISHAPIAPWFSSKGYPGGAYREIHRQVGHLIDWVRHTLELNM